MRGIKYKKYKKVMEEIRNRKIRSKIWKTFFNVDYCYFFPH